ncbi:hypothetical protein GO496_10780 [Acidovorax citrulli]|nr:hypothetical protein [Paracidovorax citrulli]
MSIGPVLRAVPKGARSWAWRVQDIDLWGVEQKRCACRCCTAATTSGVTADRLNP